MLMPKRVKRRRVFRGRMKGVATRGNKLAYGDFGIIATEPCWIKSNQIEAARIAMTRYIKRGGKVWINIFPDKPVTKKPAETRMGSGKGAPEFWVAVVKPGRVLFELTGVAEEVAREALRLAGHKLPCKTKFIKKEEAVEGGVANEINEIKNMTTQELSSKLNELKNELFNLRFSHATGNLANPMQLHNVKKDIARIKTVLRVREIAEGDKE